MRNRRVLIALPPAPVRPIGSSLKVNSAIVTVPAFKLPYVGEKSVAGDARSVLEETPRRRNLGSAFWTAESHRHRHCKTVDSESDGFRA